MQRFTEGVLRETIERARRLKAKPPTVPDIHFQVLERGCNEELDDIIQRLIHLLEELKYQDSRNQSVRLKEFKSLIRKFDSLVNIGFAALTRCNQEDDINMCRLIQRICSELNYPLQPPTVVCLSKDYYCIYPDLKLLCVPLLESDALLHLPDLYHELAHPLMIEENNPKIAPFILATDTFTGTIKSYFSKKIDAAARQKETLQADHYDLWKTCWYSWMVELFCDIFAAYTLGPAFAWSHLYLSLKRGGNPFILPQLGEMPSHPNDHIRAEVIYQVLKKTGFDNDAVDFLERWQQYIGLVSYQLHPNQPNAYPPLLIEACVLAGIEATRNIKCLPAKPGRLTPVAAIMNNAWEAFLEAPETYTETEQQLVTQLREL